MSTILFKLSIDLHHEIGSLVHNKFNHSLLVLEPYIESNTVGLFNRFLFMRMTTCFEYCPLNLKPSFVFDHLLPKAQKTNLTSLKDTNPFSLMEHLI
jgi:hypothetical protein